MKMDIAEGVSYDWKMGRQSVNAAIINLYVIRTQTY